jgi:hypothetical protein
MVSISSHVMVYPASSRGVGRAGLVDGVRLVGSLLLVCCAAFAQYPGQYPPGGYPPGGYPPGSTYPPGTYPPGTYPNGGGRGIPLPGKTAKTKPDANAPLPNFRGNLKQIDDKTITLELQDNREMQFKRTGKTKFFKNGDEVKTPKFNLGDQLSVEGPEDAQGFFTALNVYWEKGSGSHDTNTASADDSKDKDKGVSGVDAWKDEPKKDSAAKDTPPEVTARATETAPPPPPPDPDDPGRPKLVRGKPADASREHAAAVPDEPAPPQAPPPQMASAGAVSAPPVLNTGSPSILRGDDDEPVRRPVGDPLINKATEAALDFTEGLPNYVCQEMMARFQSTTHPANWQAIDVLGAAVVYEAGKEDYRDITINGKPVKKGIQQVEGAWSTGEFGTMLIDLLSPATAAQFHYTKDARTAGVNTKVYDYSVKRENSHWQITMGSQTYKPPYKGSIWIDPATARVLRIEMQAYGFPDDFPTDHVESAMDYQYTRLGDAKQYLLPVHAETLSCQRGSDFCSHNVIDFRNYHKYSGESNITFGDVKK